MPTTRVQVLLDRLASRMEGPFRRAYAEALDQMVARVNMTTLEAFLARGDIGGALKLLLDAGQVSAQSVLRTTFSTMLTAGAESTLKASANVLVGAHFTSLVAGSPRGAAAMERLEAQFFPSIFDDTASVLRQIWGKGLAAGLNPRDVARETRQYVGLTEYDYRIIQSYELDLRAGNFTEAIQRVLGDPKFDGLLRRANDDGRDLTETEIDTITGRYIERLGAWRAETWSRTASLNTARESQLTAWQEAADAAEIPPDELTKTWITTMDGRERPEHAAANGITVGIDELFPVDGGVDTPGEGVYNCRCAFTVRVVPSSASDRNSFFSTRS